MAFHPSNCMTSDKACSLCGLDFSSVKGRLGLNISKVFLVLILLKS